MKSEVMNNEAYEEFKECLKNSYLHIDANISKLVSKETYSQAISELFKVFHNLKAHAGYLKLHELYKACEVCEDFLQCLKTSSHPADQTIVKWLKDVCSLFEKLALKEDDTSFIITDTQLFKKTPPVKPQKAPEASAILKKLKVLYVEDEPEISDSLSLYIKRRVAKMKIAKNGEEGLKIFKEFMPDLIITDINMPIMHGFEMMEKIRALDNDIPVIFTTAHNEKPFIEKSRKIYSNSYLVKPFIYSDLDKELHKLARMYFQL